MLLTIPAMIMPTRFFAFWYILYRGRERYKKDTYHLEMDKSLYKPLFVVVWYAITDLIVIPILNIHTDIITIMLLSIVKGAIGMIYIYF